MGYVLDQIIKENFVEDETINSASSTDYVDISGAEKGFAIQLTWVDGSSVNMEVSLEVCVDGSCWVVMDDSAQTIAGDSGAHVWDVTETEVTYVRVKFASVSGSADFSATLTAKRRH